MATKVKMEFKKGDNTNHVFKLPLADYEIGGTLWFAAKPVPDNDAGDAAAVINKSFDDTNVTLDATYAVWALEFEPADIVGVNFTNGETNKEYVGEFQLVQSDGTVNSFPNTDDYIEVVIYADVKRGVS